MLRLSQEIPREPPMPTSRWLDYLFGENEVEAAARFLDLRYENWIIEKARALANA